MNGKQIVGLLLLLLLIYIAYQSMFIVDQRQRAVVVQLGHIVGQNYKPGLHFKLPVIQKVRRFDNRLRTLTDKIDRVLTSENKNLTVEFFVKWRIANTVKYYLATQGSEARARQLLDEIVQNDLLAEFSKRTMLQAVSDQKNQIVATVQVQANSDAKKLGIHVEDVRIMSVGLPKKVSQSVYERMRSERQEVIKALRAQGDAAAKQIRADADRERTILLANAYRQAQQTKGEGDAGAAAIYADAYGKDPDFYSFYRSLQLYRKAIGKKDFLLLQPKGKLFRYFNPPTKK